MSIKKISGLLLVMLALVSCKKELEPQESSTTADSSVVAATENATMPASPTTAAPAAQPVQMQPNVNPAMTSAPAPVAKGMNPAHGQPGHRCDIAVGAPLNSPPGKTTPQPVQNPPVGLTQSGTGKATITPTQAPTSNAAPAILNAPATVTAPGMNPPHGQPGHKCEVAVGAPLPK